MRNHLPLAHRALARSGLSLLALVTTGLSAWAGPQCPPDAFEPNDVCAQAAPVGAGLYPGLGVASAEPDFYRVSVPAGQRLEVRMHFVDPDPDLGGLLRLFADDGSVSPCDDIENQLALQWFGAPQTDLLLAWSAPKLGPADFVVELATVLADCAEYDLDIAIVPDPCASLPDDVLEENDDCAGALPLGAGSYPSLNVGLVDPDFYLVTAAPGELITLSVSAVLPSEVMTLYAWDQGIGCGASGQLAAGTTIYGGGPGGIYLFNPGQSPRSFVFEVAPVPNQGTQSGFCLEYSLAVTVEYNPCDVLGGDPFEPNSDCATAPLLTSSQTGLKLHAWLEHDWYSIDVPAHSTLRLMSRSTSSLYRREMMLFSGCDWQQDFLTSSHPLLYSSLDPREWLQWTNATDSPVNTRLFMIPVHGIVPGPFCDVYDLDLALTLGEPFCLPAKNSSGNAALLSASGSTTVGQGLLELDAAPVPPNTVGLVFFGPSHKAPKPFGGGWLCTQGPLLRLPGSSTGAGTLHTPIDWTGTASVLSAGQTWSFQAWFRDPGTSKAFNLSEGLALSLQ